MEAYKRNRGQQNIYETDGTAARKISDYRSFGNVPGRAVDPAEWRRENREAKRTNARGKALEPEDPAAYRRAWQKDFAEGENTEYSYKNAVRRQYEEEPDEEVYTEAERKAMERLERRRAEAERRQREEREQRQREAEREAQKRAVPRLANDVSFGTMILLLAAVCVTLYVCLGYLRVQANIVVTNKSISKLEKELKELKTGNEAAYNAVVEAVDFENVYKTAVAELGMVFPNKSKVLTYNADKTGYVRQFKEIPETDVLNAIKELLPLK